MIYKCLLNLRKSLGNLEPLSLIFGQNTEPIFFGLTGKIMWWGHPTECYLPTKKVLLPIYLASAMLVNKNMWLRDKEIN